jgi:GNAT superfamily N-acetyltransferase
LHCWERRRLACKRCRAPPRVVGRLWGRAGETPALPALAILHSGEEGDEVVLHQRSRVGEVERLDRYQAWELDCDPSLLRQPGVHLLSSERRRQAGWGGYTVPVLALSTAGGGVVSCRPDLVGPIREQLLRTAPDQPLGETEFERLRSVTRRVVAYAYSLSGYALYCDAGSFRPSGTLAERLLPGDGRGADLRRRFDGEIFIVSGARDEIASWAAIKLKSQDVWEIAVVTEARYRGRGYAKDVVSAATRHILDMGRLALYVHDRNNHPSASVCRSLGYLEYAEEFFCEY